MGSGADRNKDNERARLTSALRVGDENVAMGMIRAKTGWDTWFALVAAGCGRSMELKALLRGGTDPNGKSGPAMATPLMAAVEAGFKTTTRIILASNASPNETDKDGDTALHFAARAPYCEKLIELIDLLLTAGGNPSPTNTRGELPEELAELWGSVFLAAKLRA